MSISYGGHYDIRIKTKRDALDKIADVVKAVREGYKWEGPGYWNCTWNYDDISRQFFDEIDRAKKEDNEFAVLSIYCSVDDSSHGFFGEYMNPIQEAVPDMEIAVEAEFDPDEGYCHGYAYKKAKDEPLYFSTDKYGDLDFGYGISTRKTIFPTNSPWIPWAPKRKKKTKETDQRKKG